MKGNKESTNIDKSPVAFDGLLKGGQIDAVASNSQIVPDTLKDDQ